MMRWLILPLLLGLGLTTLTASEFRFLLESLETSKEGRINSEQGIVLGDGYYLFADSLSYDQKTRQLEASEKVCLYKDGHYYFQANRAHFDLHNQQADIGPLYLEDVKEGYWVYAEESCFNSQQYKITNALFSSCDPSDPFWTIGVSEAMYDVNTSWLTLRHPTFYLGNYPIAYFPYMTVNVSKQRRTGFLIPTLSYSDDEGTLFKLPFYYAPDPDWDLEVTPQIRTKRGQGLMSEFRFADTPYSSGSLQAGYFYDRQSYQDEYDLKHQDHWGGRLQYENEALLSRTLSWLDSDGLYIDAQKLNDIDYLNILHHDRDYAQKEKLITSYLNYYMNEGMHYGALYGRYFIDTTKTDNSDTLQVLPELQYHRFYDSVLFDELAYNIDLRYKNHTRDSGLNAQQHELQIPLSLYLPLLGEYLTFGVSQYFYATNVYYDNHLDSIEDGEFARTYHEFLLQSDLLKAYESFIHQLTLEAAYVKPGLKEKNGHFEDFISLPDEKEALNLAVSQHFFDKQGYRWLSHRIAQPIYFDNYDNKYGDLSSELQLRFSDDIELHQDLIYSHSNDKIQRLVHTIEWDNETSRYYLSHFFRNDEEELEDANYLVAEADYQIDHYGFFGKLGYDSRSNTFKQWEIGVDKTLRCRSFRLGYKKDTLPILTTQGSDYIEEQSIYFEFHLFPIGGIKHSFYENEKG